MIGFMFRKSSSKIIGFANVEYESLLVVKEIESWFLSKLIVMLHFPVKCHHRILESQFSLSVIERLMIHGQFQAKQHVCCYTRVLQLIRQRCGKVSATSVGRAWFRGVGTPTWLSIISTRFVARILLTISSSFAQRVMSKSMVRVGGNTGKGKKQRHVFVRCV